MCIQQEPILGTEDDWSDKKMQPFPPMNRKLCEELVERLCSMAEDVANPLTAISIRLHTLEAILTKDTPEHEAWIAVDQDITRVQRILRQFLEDFQALILNGADGQPKA